MYPYAAEDITVTEFAPNVLGIYAEPVNSPRMLIGVARLHAGTRWVVSVANTYETDRVVVDRDNVPLAAARICMHYARRAA